MPVVSPAIANDPVASRTNSTTASPLIANGRRPIVDRRDQDRDARSAQDARVDGHPSEDGRAARRAAARVWPQMARRSRTRTRASLSAAEARRLALARPGLRRPAAAAEPNGWDLRRVLKRVGLLQIDSVNVLERAHYLPAFSRLGPYPREPARPRLATSAAAAVRVLGTRGLAASGRAPAAASLAHGAGGGRCVGRDAADPARAPRAGRARARRRSPSAARCRRPSSPSRRPRRSGPWWDWSEVKWALEWLFVSGRLTAARRRRFERLYDLPGARAAGGRAERADAARGPSPARAGPDRRARARRRRRARPARLLPARRPPTRSRGSPSWSRRAS